MRRRYEDAGYGKGHRVAILLGNRPEFLLHYMALNAIGASIVPVNLDYRHAELSYLLDHSETSLVICSADRAADMDAAIEQCAQTPDVIDGIRVPETIPVPGARPDQGPIDLNTECALLFTSRTTERPKGCILTQRLFFDCRPVVPRSGGADDIYGRQGTRAKSLALVPHECACDHPYRNDPVWKLFNCTRPVSGTYLVARCDGYRGNRHPLPRGGASDLAQPTPKPP